MIATENDLCVWLETDLGFVYADFRRPDLVLLGHAQERLQLRGHSLNISLALALKDGKWAVETNVAGGFLATRVWYEAGGRIESVSPSLQDEVVHLLISAIESCARATPELLEMAHEMSAAAECSEIDRKIAELEDQTAQLRFERRRVLANAFRRGNSAS